MIQLSLVGIGSGNPEHLTLQAVRVLRQVDLILIPQKSSEKKELAALREAICADVAPDVPLVPFDMPVRDPKIAEYTDRVEAWHDAIAAVWRAALAPLDGAGHAALLVWGDPSLYDSTLRIAGRLDVAVDVVPGITSVQAMTAAHAEPLNTLGGAVAILPARRLRDAGWPAGIETIVVMLDDGATLDTLDPDLRIWWTAYAGMPQEVSLGGRLGDVLPDLTRLRAAERARHGWIMDTTLLRRPAPLPSVRRS